MPTKHRTTTKQRQALRVAPMAEMLTPLTRVLIVGGSTMCGKTNMLCNVLDYQHSFVGEHPEGVHWKGNNFKFAMSFSKTEPANGNFGGKKIGEHGVVPWMLARDNFDRDLVKAFLKYQMQCSGIDRAKPSMIIGDDLMCDKKAVNCPEMLELLMNSRNYLVGADMTSHGTKLLDDKARTNFQVIIAFDVGGDDEAEKLRACFFSTVFRKKKSFMRTYRRVLKTPYQAMVIDLRRKGEINNRVFKYRAPKDVKRPHLAQLGFWEVSAIARQRNLMLSGDELFNLEAIHKRLGITSYTRPKVVRAASDSVSVAAGGAGDDGGGRGRGRGGGGGDGDGDAAADVDALGDADSEDDSEDERGLLV